MYFQLPPRKRRCLNLKHYSTPCSTPVKANLNISSLTSIRESLPNVIVQQPRIHSITTHKRETLYDFHVFRWLPKELQLQIWNAAAADIDAQIITISSEAQHIKPQQQINQQHQSSAYTHNELIFLTAQYIVPNILHACQDAREVALKYYRPVFSREIGGAPIYMAIDNRRARDTFLFSNLTALQMLRSRTQNFRIMINDMDFIKSAIVCTDILQDSRKDPQRLRWIISSLRKIDELWIAGGEIAEYKGLRTTPMILKHMPYILVEVMISQHATKLQQKQSFAGFNIYFEAVQCSEDPEYCFAKWGFRVPKLKATSLHQLKEIAGQVIGRRAQSRVTLEYLHKILKDTSLPYG